MAREPLFEVRNSPVHGLGAFALRRIPKGTRIVEYLGERVSHQEADRRYESKDVNDAHTFLFIVDSRTVIDAGVDGNEARFLNHSCNPNCESVIEKRRVFIEAIRDIEPGEEMTYDYQIQREDDDPPGIEEVFACHCGFPQCRGTMLWPPDPPARSRKSKRKRQPAAAKRTRHTRSTEKRRRNIERARGTAGKSSRRR
jgi:SET domain-containing protein